MTLTAPTPFGPPSPYPVNSSRWWIERLTQALANRLQRFEMLDDYYRGEQDLRRLAGQAWRESELASQFPKYLHANHSKLIVNATAHRLVVQGFRLAGQLRADTEASRIWTANEMEAESEKAIVESLVKGECPVIVEPNPLDPTTPVITAQDPSEVIVWTAPTDRRIRLAALKTWWDYDQSRRFYILFLPDRIEWWRDRESGAMDWWMNTLFGRTPDAWTMTRSVRNPLREVPVVTIPNDPRLSGQPEGEHEAVLGRIDHYNKTLMNMAVTSHELAFPQRFASGVESQDDVPLIDPATGEPVVNPDTGETVTQPAHRTGQTRWITTENDQASFGQFAAATIDNYVKELDQIRADIATDTFTPYHFLLNMPSSVPPSGESIYAVEVPLVDKVRSHARDKGAAFRTIMRLGFMVIGDVARAEAMRAGATLWQDPERRTEAQHVDALGKLRTMLELPRDAVWEMLPATPEQIDRWTRMLDEPGQALPQPVAPAAPDVTPAAPVDQNGATTA